MRVLITERDPLVRQWLGLEAGRTDVEMIFASNGGEALRMMQDQSVDCVVLDACSSTDQEAPLWSQLRQAPETRHIPVLLYSSSDRWQRVAELAGAQLDGFLARPFTPEILLQAARLARSRHLAQA